MSLLRLARPTRRAMARLQSSKALFDDVCKSDSNPHPLLASLNPPCVRLKHLKAHTFKSRFGSAFL